MVRHNSTFQTLGYAGLVPFAALALLLWQPSLLPGSMLSGIEALAQQHGYQAFLGYSAVILSFLGGIFWGHALQAEGETRPTLLLVISNVFALVAWMALMLDSSIAALSLLAAGYLTLLAAEWRLSATFPHLPQWSLSSYLPMRIILTVVVVSLHVVVLLHVLSHQIA